MYLTVKTQSVLRMLSNDEFYIHSDGSLEY